MANVCLMAWTGRIRVQQMVCSDLHAGSLGQLLGLFPLFLQRLDVSLLCRPVGYLCALRVILLRLHLCQVTLRETTPPNMNCSIRFLRDKLPWYRLLPLVWLDSNELLRIAGNVRMRRC